MSNCTRIRRADQRPQPANRRSLAQRGPPSRHKPRRRVLFDVEDFLADTVAEPDELVDRDGPSFRQLLEEGEQDDDQAEDDDFSIHETAGANLDEQARETFVEGLSQEDQWGVFTKRWMWRILQEQGQLSIACRRAADILAALIFWTKPGKGKRPNARRGLQKPWTATSSKELAETTGWTEDGVTKSLKILKERGFIGWTALKFGGKKRRHIWINWDAIRRTWDNQHEPKTRADESEDE